MPNAKKIKVKVNNMSLVQDWEKVVTQYSKDAASQQKFWTNYYMKEKSVYEQLLTEPVEVVTGTVKEPVLFLGFLDGINESIKEPNPIEELEEDSVVTMDIDLEKLYYNMVEARAEWLYQLPQWDNLLPAERRKELYKAQKSSTTVVKGKKIGRNDPCPCGSGKKYKFCCGK